MTSIFRISMAAALAAVAAISLTQKAFSEDFEFWPGAQYDPAIPTVESVLGYPAGERITTHPDMLRYFDALAEAAPDRVRIYEYARTWEGRSLIYVAISSPENISALDAFSDNMQRLADPRQTDAAAAQQMIADLPGSVWLAYGVHGNEISSTDAGMMTAYHLLAAENDPRAPAILANTVVFIDPLQNPDGRTRFIQSFTAAEGLEPDANRLAAEHNEPWPNGRTNHYLFDMNRDWFALTQPETQGRVLAMLEYFPLVVIDLHEMGSDGTYYFTPEADPFNPHLTPQQRSTLDLFGKNNARWFDRFGFRYFTREEYDNFYPGYGASWMEYHGAIAATYEQASARGLKWRRLDGSKFHYRDTVRHHFVTSLSTAEVVSDNRQMLLRQFYDYRASAIAEGRQSDNRYRMIRRDGDYSAADKLAGLLVAQGIEVSAASQGFRACGTDYSAGTYVIDTAQPAERMIRTLMDRQVDMDDAFLAEQEHRRQRNLPDQIYDVTAWSLPLMYNVAVDGCGRVPAGERAAVEPRLFLPGNLTGPTDAVAYLVPWGSRAAVRFLAAALRNGVKVLSSDAGFTHEGTAYPSGTLIIQAAGNGDGLRAKLSGLAADTGANVTAISSTWVTEGPNLGSDRVVTVPAPKIAILWDNPTLSYTAGNTRFVVERQFGYPVTAIRTATLSRPNLDLSAFDVIIMPETGFGGGYGGTLGEAGLANLKRWVTAGGTLVGIGTGTRYLTDPDVDLISTRREDLARPEGGDGDGGGKGAKGGDSDKAPKTVPGELITSEDQFMEALVPDSESPDSVAGIIARAAVDGEHWLGAGVSPTLNVLVRGGDIYQPITLDKGVNVAHFAGADDLLASGYIWQENRDQLAYKPFAIVQPTGRGNVIAFTQDPNARAYLDGLNVIFMNALFRGPAHSGRER